MFGFKSFRRAQAILTGFKQIHIIRKVQYEHLAGDGWPPAENFHLKITSNAGNTVSAAAGI